MQEYAKNIARWILWTFFEEYKQLLTVDSWLLEPSTEPEKKVRVMESSSYREFEANYINGNKQIDGEGMQLSNEVYRNGHWISTGVTKKWRQRIDSVVLQRE